jgi:hypothetical protein
MLQLYFLLFPRENKFNWIIYVLTRISIPVARNEESWKRGLRTMPVTSEDRPIRDENGCPNGQNMCDRPLSDIFIISQSIRDG